MPENPALLHVVACTSDGLVRDTMRLSTGWTKFGDPLAAAGLESISGKAVDVACARFTGNGQAVEEGLYVLIAFDELEPKLLFRSADTGTWREMLAPTFPISRRVAATVAHGAGGSPTLLHTAAIIDSGELFAAAQEHNPSQAAAPSEVEWTAGARGTMRSVALFPYAAIEGPSHVVLLAAAEDGQAYRAEGGAPTWSQYLNLENAFSGSGKPPGDVVDVAAGGYQYGIVTGDGHVWSTSYSGSTWNPWRNLELASLSVLFPFSVEVDVGTFATITMASTSEGLHVLGTTTNGRVWHELRNSPFVTFKDIEVIGVGQDIGTVSTVAAA